MRAVIRSSHVHISGRSGRNGAITGSECSLESLRAIARTLAARKQNTRLRGIEPNGATRGNKLNGCEGGLTSRASAPRWMSCSVSVRPSMNACTIPSLSDL